MIEQIHGEYNLTCDICGSPVVLSRRHLHDQGLTAQEIAEIEGSTVRAIYQWKHKNHLTQPEKVNVLARPIWEREIIRRFMGDLLHTVKKGNGKNYRVGEFMKTWREMGVPHADQT